MGTSDSAPLTFGDLTFDPETLDVRRDGKPHALTTTELKLPQEFAAVPGMVLTRDLQRKLRGLLEDVLEVARLDARVACVETEPRQVSAMARR